jgi:hypothetical protein
MSYLSETIQGWVSAAPNLKMDCVLMPAQPFQITFPSVARPQCWQRKDMERRKMLVIVLLSSVKSSKGSSGYIHSKFSDTITGILLSIRGRVLKTPVGLIHVAAMGKFTGLF